LESRKRASHSRKTRIRVLLPRPCRIRNLRQHCGSKRLGSCGLMSSQVGPVDGGAGYSWAEADSRNEMVIDLEDGIHFALHLLTGPRDSDASPEGCGNTETTKVTCAQPLGRAGCPNRKQSFDAIPTTLSHKRGSRAFEVGGLHQCRPHLASRSQTIVILDVTSVNRLYALLTSSGGPLYAAPRREFLWADRPVIIPGTECFGSVKCFGSVN
jgi:hypothetical protein